MGLFSSDKKTNTSNAYDTTTTTTQLDQSGNQGFNVGMGGSLSLSTADNSVSYTLDGGAIAAIERVNADSIGLLGGIVSSGLDAQQQVTARALDFGGRALESVARVNADSVAFLGGLVDNVIDSSRTFFRDSAEANSKSLSDALAGFGTLAKQSTESSDDRVSKVALYALAAVVAALVLPSLFKGARATA